MAHISRKELRTDEVRETFAHGAEALLSHKQFTIWVAGIAIVAALSFYGWRAHTQRQTARASAAFDGAMRDFQARIVTPGDAPQPGELTYADEKVKFQDAAKKFGSVADSYPRTRPGQLAEYYEALSLEKLGKHDDAKKLLEELANSNDEEFAAMARLELAGLSDRTGHPDQAVKLYQQLMDKPTVLVPKPVVLLALAEHYGQKNPSEAAKLYGQIKSEYPGTPIAQQAEQELALLPGQS